MMKTIHKTTTKCLALVVLMLVTMLTGAQADTVTTTATFNSSVWGTTYKSFDSSATDSWTNNGVKMAITGDDMYNSRIDNSGIFYVYYPGNLTFTAPTGCTFTGLTITGSGDAVSASTGTLTANATSGGYTWSGSASTLTLSPGADGRDLYSFESIVVTYEADLNILATTTSDGAEYRFHRYATPFVGVSLNAKTITAGSQEMYLLVGSEDPMIMESPTNGSTYLHMPAGSTMRLQKSENGSNVYITRAAFTCVSGNPDVYADGGEYDSSTGIWTGQEEQVDITFNEAADIQLVQVDAAAYAKVTVTTYGRGQTAVDGVGIDLENDLNGNPTGTTTVYVAVGGSLALAMTPDDARHELSTASVRESYWDAEDNYHSDETDFLNDAKENGSYTMWNIQHNCDVTIRYSWITHLISYHASGNGTINLVATYLDDDGTSMSYDQAEQMYGGEAARDNTEDRKISIGTGGTVNMIMTADTGYKLSSLMVNGVEMVNSENLAKDGSVYTYTINPLTAAQNISATFVNDTPEAYAVLSDNNTVLTFYYDTEKESRGGVVVGADTGISGISNASAGETVTSVVLDQSMANCTTITNTASWFSNFTQLSRITGLEYLNTSNVTSMNNMFYNCSQLSDIDLSHFDTGRVTDMGGMFMQCSSLTTLDLTSFSTAAVTNMIAMFMDCSNLETITVGQGWTTSNLEMSSSMFSGCTSLKGSKGTTYDADHTDDTYARVDGGETAPGYLSDPNAPTAYDVLVKVVGNGEVNVGSLTISGGSEEHITMPAGGNLKIFLSPATGYKIDKVELDGVNMNDSIVPATATAAAFYTLWKIYDSHTVTVTFANDTPEAYAVLSESNTVLTFYYDTNKESRGGLDINTRSWDIENGEESPYGSITKAVFDASFANYRPTSTAYWFQGCRNMTTVEGMENLNTSNVTDMWAMFDWCGSLESIDLSRMNTANAVYMAYMFNGCSSLTSLDVSRFSTENATDIGAMFRYCSKLTTVDVSHFNTSKVKSFWGLFAECTSLSSLDVSNFDTGSAENMAYMFYNCKQLQSLDVSHFNTQNVTDMGLMFRYCSSLTSLDLSSFNTQNVTNMRWMFSYCSSLTSLDVTGFNTSNVTDMSGLFYYCSSLPSIDVTHFNTTKVTNMENVFGECHALTNVDVSNFNTENVTNMDFMFGATAISELNLSNFNTDNVTNMRWMFSGYGVTSVLKTVDLSSFNTSKVENMEGMFAYSSQLTTIFVGEGWNTSSVSNSTDMFIECTSLVGGRETTYDASNIDATYARIDMAPDAPGYFTRTVVMGDANDDGSVTIADAVATVTNILNEATNEYFSQSKADMNSDSEIDIFDVTLIVNAVLAASPAPAYNGGNIAAEDVRLEAQANSLTMGISGSAPYTAFQFDVTLPEGTTLEGVRLANKATNHQLVFKKVGDNTYRVVGLSMTNQQLSAANGRLVQLQLSGNADESNVKMSNVLFVGQPATDATAIRNHVADGAADRGAIYDLNGRYVGNDRRQLSKGIYIINHKKVNIK